LILLGGRTGWDELIKGEVKLSTLVGLFHGMMGVLLREFMKTFICGERERVFLGDKMTEMMKWWR